MSKKNIDNERKHLGFPSLKEAHKRLELQRIVEENQRLLTRIQNTAPVYNHLQWEQEAEHRVDILRNMTEFPDYFKPPGNSNLMIMKKKAQDFTEKQMEKSSRSPTRSSSRGGTGLGGSGSGYEYRPRTGESHNSENFGKPPSPAQRAGREVIRPVSSSNITHYEHHQQQQLGDYENNY